MEIMEKGGINNVVIERSQLLEIIKSNKEKHNVIFEVAVQGYWKKLGRELGKKWLVISHLAEEAQQKMKDFQETGKFKLEFKDRNFNYSFSEQFPENHEADYNRVIKMLELSVHDKFSLNENEFNLYVMNNWAWKKSFINSSVSYMQGYSGFCGLTGYSGYGGTSGYSGYSGYKSMKEIKEILESF